MTVSHREGKPNKRLSQHYDQCKKCEDGKVNLKNNNNNNNDNNNNNNVNGLSNVIETMTTVENSSNGGNAGAAGRQCCGDQINSIGGDVGLNSERNREQTYVFPWGKNSIGSIGISPNQNPLPSIGITYLQALLHNLILPPEHV